MRILIVSQYYPPENTHLVPSLAHSLTARGHDVRVLTGFPNYPSGKIFGGYRQRWRQHELDDEVSVCRVPLYPDHSRTAALRMLNYLSFGLSAATARRHAKDVDVVYVYATQLTAAIGPWLWRLIAGPPYVLHIQDLWPDSIVGSSLVRSGLASRALSRLLNPWIRSVYRHAAAIVGIAPTMVKTLVNRGVPESKARLVCNWADEHRTRDEPARAKALRTEGVNILYAGNVGDMQDLETAVRAAHRARDAGVHLTILGDGVGRARVRALARDLDSSNITFKDPVPGREVASAYRAADFALVCLKDLPAFAGTIPSKFQAALSQGVPVISTVQGDVRNLVDTLDIGFVADAESPTSLETALRAAANLSEPDRRRMSARALQAYSDRFSLAAAVTSLEAILSEAASRSVGRR